MRSKFTLVQPGQPQVPTDAFLPQNEYFHTDAWKAGLDASDAPEDLGDGQSPEMQDMEVTQDDRLVVAPGVAVTETLAHVPSQIFLHAGAKFASSVILVSAPFLGVKESGATSWFDAGLKTGEFGFTNYAGILLMSNGISGLYARRPGKLQLDLIAGAPPAFALTVFAGRVVLGGTLIDGSMDFMGVQWSDSTNDYKGWDAANGAAGQSLIGSMRQADKIMDFASLGFETLVVLCRRSIWIGVQTGDEFQPIRFTPRLEDTGCSHRKTIVPTEFGVVFLSDDGVRLFTGSEAPIISEAINPLLGTIDDTQDWSAGFDPKRKRYYLHGPNGTWVFDFIRRRWFRWLGTALNSVFFPSQQSQLTWDQATGTWDSQTLTWWQLLPQESGGRMLFVKGSQLGYENDTISTFFDSALDPRWFSRRTVAENLDVLITALGSRFIYEATSEAKIELWLPDKPDGNFEVVVSQATLFPGTATKRAWVPYIHTGRGIGLGLRVISGRPSIRKASVEFQRTSLPWPIEDTLQVGGGSEGSPIQSNAIMKPRSVYYQSYDLGVIQGLRRDLNFDPSPFWTIVSTGGRGGFGYASSVKNAAPAGGSFSLIPMMTRTTPWGVIEDHPVQAGCVIAFNLFGQALAVSMNCIGFFARHDTLGDGADRPQVVVSVRPDLKLQASLLVLGALVPITNGVDTAISTVTVPASGWFALEPQVAVSAIDNDESGFVSLRLYTEDGPPEGVEAFRVLNCKTRSESSSDCLGAYAYGTEVVAALGPGLDDIGCDDVHLYGAYGATKGFMYDTLIGAGLPSADGDIIESTVSYDSTHTVNPPDPRVVGGPSVWGVSPRVNNLSGGPTRPDLDEHTFPTSPDEDPSAPSGNNIQPAQFHLGSLSPFTGTWLDGPFAWPDAPDTMPRNTFDDNQTDTYRLRILRADIAELVGIQPILATSHRYIGNDLFPFNWVGLHGIHTIEANALVRAGLRLGGVSDIGRYFWAPSFGPGGPNWKPMSGYTKEPWSVHIVDPLGAAIHDPGILGALQVLVKADRSLADLDGDPARHWVETSIIQAGIEYAYRRASIVTIEHAPFAPVPKLVQFIGTDLTSRHLVVRDASVDWDGTIVSRVVDWGDGSPTEVIAASPRLYMAEVTAYPTLSHDFAGPGTYNVIVTVTDSDGLVSVDTLVAVCPNQSPVANFSAAADPGDPTNQTADFTDLSVDPDGTIAAWDWDFGDGSPHSNAQNPTHVYAAAGTFNVTLQVTDNLGAINSITAPIDLPFAGGGAGDCTLSADALADTAFVQGDDFNGGNPPLPSYANTSAFDSYFNGTPFREAYDSNDAVSGADHAIDSGVTFSGHKTLRCDYSATQHGAGWSSVYTDDGDPTEAYYTSAPNGPTGLWFRHIFKADAGVMSQTGLGSGDQFLGLTIFDISGSNIEYALNVRGGHLYLDVTHRPTSDGHAFQVDTFDLGLEIQLIGTPGFVELIGRYTRDLTARTSRLKLWWGDSCTLAAAAPSYDSGDIDSHIGTSGSGLTKELALTNIHQRFIRNFTPSGTLKSIWHALWEMEPDSVSANPYGVGSP